MASIVSSTGLGSGIDINGLVTQLVEAEQKPVTTRLDKKEAGIQAKVTAFGTFKSALADFRSSLSGLTSLNQFRQVSATSSNEDILTVSAASNADLGNYKVEVKQLAQSHALASSGTYKTANDPVGTGTLTIKFGTYTVASGASGTTSTFTQNAEKGSLTLNIDGTNNTLSGIRDAINKANAGVSAAILFNGTGYQLVLNSADSGAKNAMQITGIDALQYTGGTVAGDAAIQTQSAEDALLNINGLPVSSASNTVSNVLKGVTFKLLKAEDPNSKTLVDVAVNKGSSDETSKALEAFTKAYNDLLSTIKEVASYDAEAKKAGPLLGDPAVQGAMSMVRSLLTQPIPGLTGSVKSLVDIGLKTNADGTVSLDSRKLSKALESNRDEVAALFSVIGRPSDSGVQYVDANFETQPGSYGVEVTHAATQGTLKGGVAFALSVGSPLVITEGVNDSFSINVDGAVSGTIKLTAGSYTDPQSLLTEIQSRINGDESLRKAGLSVTATLDDSNHLLISSKSYGAASKVSIGSSNASLGLDSTATATDGTDIAGTIGGLAAEGKGQQLSAIGGAATGLKVFIEDNSVGLRGSVVFSRGLMERLDKALGSILGSSGSVASRSSGLQKDLDQIIEDRTKLAERMEKLQVRLLKQFTAMDSLVGQLQSMGSYLSQQLKNLPYSGNSK